MVEVLVFGDAIGDEDDERRRASGSYSLYVQLSRCRSLDGMIALSKARERDIIGNTVPENMVAAEKRLEELKEAIIREAET